MTTRTGCYALLALTAIMFAGVPQAANAAEKIELLGPSCFSDAAQSVITYEVKLSQLDAAHPIKAVNFNVGWNNKKCCGTCQTDCWQIINVTPEPGWDQFGSDNQNCGDDCKCIKYSLTRALGTPGITQDAVIAKISFLVTLPVDKCCVEVIHVTAGSGASATKVAGDAGYVRDVAGGLVLGDDVTTRIDRQAPVITQCPSLTRTTDAGVCTWTPKGLCDACKPDECTDPLTKLVLPCATDNCDTCDCTLKWSYKINEGCEQSGVFTPLDPAVLAATAWPAGCTLITWKVEDCCGNFALACQTIDVQDNEDPVVVPPEQGLTVAADEHCQFVVPDVRSLFTITDNCTVDPIVTQMPPVGTVWGLGEHDITVNAVDNRGNNVTAAFIYTVEDKTPPEFTQAPTEIKVPADAGKCCAVVKWIIAADDPQCNDPVTVTCDYCSGACFPIGTTEVTCTAADKAGNVATHKFNVVVDPNWVLDVTVALKGYVNKKPFDRCVLVEVADCKNILPAQTAKGTLTFTNGVATGQLLLAVPQPCLEGTYNCARAKDYRHSLWSKTDSALAEGFISGTVFKVSFVADNALRLGNVNGDKYVDIVDWIIWQAQFLTPQVLPAEDCTDPLPDLSVAANQTADVSGDGKVSAIDYGHLYVNNFQEDAPLCCVLQAPLAADAGPRTRVAVSELKALGMEYAAGLDYNGDGYIDVADMKLAQK